MQHTDKSNEPVAENFRNKVSVIVLNYKTPELTIGCLESISGANAEIVKEIIVVDNASGDNSVPVLKDWIARAPASGKISLIEAASNGGFSAGNNIGMRAASAEYFLLLNSDARLLSGALSALLHRAETYPMAGAIAPRLEGEDAGVQRSAFRFASPASEFMAGANSAPISKLLRRFEVAPRAPDEFRQTPWASFACILLRAEAVKSAGPMDEGFFMYFEDAEYCARLARMGWKVFYEPKARAVHLRGGSSPVKALMARGERPPAYYYESRTRFFRKQYGPPGPVMANICWMAGRAIAYLRPLTGRALPIVCKNQARDIWMNWRTPLKSKRSPAAQKKI